MRRSKLVSAVATFAAAAVALSACGTESGGGGEDDGTPVRVQIAEPQNTLIPGNTAETGGSEVLHALFTPLVKYTEDKKAEEELAESFESEDNKTWTIKLKEGWTFHNGEPVTAESFVRAWNYTANQENAQEGNYFFQRIDGYADLNPGEGKKPKTDKMKGLKAVDDLTLEVTLAEPFSQFKMVVGYTAFYPLPEAAFDDKGALKEDFGSNPIGNGPFKMDKPFKKGSDQTIDMSAYDKFAGTKPKVSKVQFKLYTNMETAFNDLRAGEVDIMDQLPPNVISTAKAELGDRFIQEPSASIAYVGFPIGKNPAFKSLDVRKAVSLAIDRKAITEKVFSGTTAPADDFINPAVEGYKQGACTVCKLDPAEAKKLYAKGKGPKTLELAYNADGPHKEWIEAVANNLRKNLEIDVTVKPFEKFAAILDDLEARKYDGLFRMGWAIDYPSPENYLTPIFATGAITNGSNYADYSNKEFDKLLTEGDTAETPEAGLEKYREAADILNEDLPYIPVYFYRLNAAYSDKLSAVEIDPVEHIDWTVVEKA